MAELNGEPIFLTTNGFLQNQLSTGYLKRLGAWSYLINHSTGQNHSSGSSINTSSDKMALTAILRGLQKIPCQSYIEITVSNEMVMNGVTLWLYAWKKNNWRTHSGSPIENRELWQELEKLLDFHTKVTWKLANVTTLRPETHFVNKLCELEIASVISGL